jgi:hypothetical protein
MKKIIILATAGIFLLSLQAARAQKEVPPPPVPPLLEGSRPLATPDTKEAAPPKVGEEKAKPTSKAKGKAKTAQTTKKKTAAKKNGNKKKPPKVAKKKGSKAAAKTKKPAGEPAAPSGTPGPDES